MKTVSELLAPRYKAVFINGHHYPNSPYVEGEIFTVSNYGADILTSDYGRFLDGQMAKNHPALFKPLQWWEEREVSDMPEYVKSETSSLIYRRGVFKFISIRKDADEFVVESKTDGLSTRLYGKHDNVLPATLSEFTTYTQKNKL